MALAVYSPSVLNILKHLKKESFWNKPLTRTNKNQKFCNAGNWQKWKWNS
jgi:hypothetical protein